LWEFSEEEISILYKEVITGELEDIKQMAIATRLGVNADAKQFKRVMKEYDEAGKGDRPKERGINSQFVEKLQVLNKLRGSGARNKGRPNYKGRVPRRPPPPSMG